MHSVAVVKLHEKFDSPLDPHLIKIIQTFNNVDNASINNTIKYNIQEVMSTKDLKEDTSAIPECYLGLVHTLVKPPRPSQQPLNLSLIHI